MIGDDLLFLLCGRGAGGMDGWEGVEGIGMGREEAVSGLTAG